jgi:hypothetical protein
MSITAKGKYLALIEMTLLSLLEMDLSKTRRMMQRAKNNFRRKITTRIRSLR